LKFTTFPAITYDTLLAAGVHSLSVNYQSFAIQIRPIEALLFPKKLVFRVGKKAVANRQALLQLLAAR